MNPRYLSADIWGYLLWGEADRVKVITYLYVVTVENNSSAVSCLSA